MSHNTLTLKSSAMWKLSRVAPQALLNALRTKGEADHPELYNDLAYAKYRSDGKRTLILTPTSETIIGWVEPGLGWLDEKGYQLLHEEVAALPAEETISYNDIDDIDIYEYEDEDY